MKKTATINILLLLLFLSGCSTLQEKKAEPQQQNTLSAIVFIKCDKIFNAIIDKNGVLEQGSPEALQQVIDQKGKVTVIDLDNLLDISLCSI